MDSRRRSQDFSRKGSMLRSRESKLGASDVLLTFGSDFSDAREDGKSRAVFGGSTGSWCRSDVRMCELWMVSGSSMRISWYLSPDF